MSERPSGHTDDIQEQMTKNIERNGPTGVPKNLTPKTLDDGFRDINLAEQPKKRYGVTIFGNQDNNGVWQYRNSITPFGNSLSGTLHRERRYKDEAEMVQVVSSVHPLLAMQDKKHALDLIRRHEGLTNVVSLTDSQAALLGWSQG